MTLGEAKRKVLMLLDEYTSGGTVTEDADIAAKMRDFFDIAQKDVAQVAHIVKTAELDPVAGDDTRKRWAVPADCDRILRLWSGEERITAWSYFGRYEIRTSKAYMMPPTMEYCAMPADIPADAGDSYVFEVSQRACNCIPFYVASMQLFPDLTVDYGAYLSEYLRMKAALDPTVPGDGGGRIRQGLFAGR